MMTSPLSKSGISCSMTISTGFPALIISITFLGFFNIDISVFTSSVPPIGNPFARPFKKVLTVLIFLEFTATENRIIEIITDGMLLSMQSAWKDLVDTKFEIQSREENIQLISFVDGDDTVIVCSFMVQMPQHDPVSFDIVYPLQTLKPISSQLRSRVQNEYAVDDRTWKERLQNAVLSVPLTLSAELGRPRTTLGKLWRSKVGDTFTMALPENVLIKVEGQSVFRADVGKVGPNAAVSMKNRVRVSEKKDG